MRTSVDGPGAVGDTTSEEDREEGGGELTRLLCQVTITPWRQEAQLVIN